MTLNRDKLFLCIVTWFLLSLKLPGTDQSLNDWLTVCFWFLAEAMICFALQDEGHWNEASLYREGIRETLRSEGMNRKEANRVAWEKMLEVFPPFDAEEEAAHCNESSGSQTGGLNLIWRS